MARKADGLGLFGALLNPRYPDKQRIKFAAELEDLGFRTIWLGGGREPAATCAYTRRRCARRARPPSCRRSSVCGASRPRQWRRGTTGSTRSFGDRFLLGIGAGHPETQSRYERPYAKVTDYLNRLDAAGERILAALSPKTLSLAGRPCRRRPPVPGHPGPHPRRP